MSQQGNSPPSPTFTATDGGEVSMFEEAPPDPNLTARDLQTLADHAVSSGFMTREQADSSMRDVHGVEPIKPDAPILVDDEESAFFGTADPFAGAKPEHYSMPPLPLVQGEISKEALEFDREVRGWLSTGQFTREIGSQLARDVYEAAGHQRDASDDARKVYAVNETQKLRKMWGPKFTENLNLARQYLAELDAKHEGRIVDFLEETGAGNSHAVIVRIWQQANLLRQRRKS